MVYSFKSMDDSYYATLILALIDSPPISFLSVSCIVNTPKNISTFIYFILPHRRSVFVTSKNIHRDPPFMTCAQDIGDELSVWWGDIVSRAGYLECRTVGGYHDVCGE